MNTIGDLKKAIEEFDNDLPVRVINPIGDDFQDEIIEYEFTDLQHCIEIDEGMVEICVYETGERQ